GDLMLSGFLLLLCIGFIGLTLRTQLLVTLNESLAIARGISVSLHRTLFIVLLSLVVAVSIKAVGVLLVSAFVVIPACTARLLSRGFSHYVLFSASFGVFCAVFGIIFSALFDLPSGPSIVATQFGVFLSAIGLRRA
ncbi:MAG: metal ABC transporter permease, partial [Cyanobacteria bacterium]|nr:metal ABC transporter permease [Cyanobacteria bacterium GSL.Bin1]